RRFAADFPQIPYQLLGCTEWSVSAAGFGTYRIHPDVDQHRQALAYALQNGINLIDTSSNYADGKAEELTGQVLQKLAEQGTVDRSSVIVVTKGGYIQGQNLTITKDRAVAGNSFPEVVELRENLQHCIHPDFLDDQIERSMQRLNLQTIDVYLLHNPEYYLKYAKEVDIPQREAIEEYYRRIEKAFSFLESEVDRGRIQYYGVSSNAFPRSDTEFEHTSLWRLLEIANSIKRKNHFAVIQMPLNLMETQAVTEVNQNNGRTTLQIADENRIGTLINRPLNAVRQGKLIRLTDITGSISANQEETESYLNVLIRQENHFEKNLLPTFNLDSENEQLIKELLSTGSYLAMHWQKLGPYEQWLTSQSKILVERIDRAMQILTKHPMLNNEQKQWIQYYTETFNNALDGLTALYKRMAVRQNNQLKKMIQSIEKDWDNARGLTHKALRAIRSTSGIHCTLVGMRHEDYVKDILQELKQTVPYTDRLQSWSKLKNVLKNYADDRL
ncbi:MAG: hypothetical protein GF313_04645, partial [Caldithrix sp.]|nr:hypothetical protein [Caldithrix sp.]